MEVMTTYKFFDEDVKSVRMDFNPNNREIVLKNGAENSLLINKEDVIALAKDFNLFVFEKSASL